MNLSDDDLVTPLNIACDEGKIEIVSIAFKKQSSIEHTEIIQLLEEAGAK